MTACFSSANSSITTSFPTSSPCFSTVSFPLSALIQDNNIGDAGMRALSLVLILPSQRTAASNPPIHLPISQLHERPQAHLPIRCSLSLSPFPLVVLRSLSLLRRRLPSLPLARSLLQAISSRVRSLFPAHLHQERSLLHPSPYLSFSFPHSQAFTASPSPTVSTTAGIHS